MSEEHPNPERLYRHRRWMAWLSLLAIVGMHIAAAAGYVDDSAAQIIQTTTWALWLVVLGYVANCAIDSVAQHWYKV